MKILLKSLLTFLIALLSTHALSQQLIPFQARLTDGAGAPVADGVYAINFAIYDVATGGTPVNGWVESHATTSVVGGVVNVILGGITPLNDPDNDGDLSDAVTFYTADGNRFIGVTIDAGQEMVPRHQLIVSFHARIADDAATLGGNLPSYYTSLNQHNADILASLNQHNADILAINNQLAGAIIAFSGSCPAGWLLADGTLGTPDLRNRFLRGESTGNPGSLDSGGNDDAIVVGHNHSINPPPTSLSINTGGSHRHELKMWSGGASTSGDNIASAGYTTITNSSGRSYPAGSDHSHTGSVNIPAFNSASVGSSATNANIPNYYEVIYCVKQ